MWHLWKRIVWLWIFKSSLQSNAKNYKSKGKLSLLFKFRDCIWLEFHFIYLRWTLFSWNQSAFNCEMIVQIMSSSMILSFFRETNCNFRTSTSSFWRIFREMISFLWIQGQLFKFYFYVEKLRILLEKKFKIQFYFKI